MGFPIACVWLSKGTCHVGSLPFLVSPTIGTQAGQRSPIPCGGLCTDGIDTGWFEGTNILRNLHILPVADNLYQFVVRYCHIVFSLSHNMIHQSFINRLSIVRQPFNQQLELPPSWCFPRICAASLESKSSGEEFARGAGNGSGAHTDTRRITRIIYHIYIYSYIMYLTSYLIYNDDSW